MPERLPDRRIALLGTFVDSLTFQETLLRIEEIVESRRPTQHVVLNAAKIVAIQSDPVLKGIVEGCGLINADGASVVWASRILGIPLPERVTGIDLMHALIERAATRKWRIFFLGARREVLEKVVSRVRRDYPGAEVAGSHHGYFGEEDSPRVVDAIAASHADLLFVGLPSPRKEAWLQQHLAALGVPFCMGVGGSFDVFAGVVRRAPGWVQAIGMEWFYRFLQEPRRLWRRYLLTNGRFLLLVIRERTARRHRDPNERIV
jgi:exopolysaccharide biosynthesis WecB/TagA/CpsF family protein